MNLKRKVQWEMSLKVERKSNRIRLLNKLKWGNSEEQEKSSSSQSREEEHEDGTILPEIKTDLAIIEEALERNEVILKELEEHLASAEKRFFKFMEKAVSPVLDGLYSGKKFANDLIEELAQVWE